MGVLSELEPKSVFYFFEEICKIPHGSGNIDRISDYLVQFAKERNLFYIQDKVKNVIIVKEATKGYEKESPFILQGHMDMVAVKKPDVSIDMETEPLQLAIEGDEIYAEGTSLGGDDGIAVAYALAILDSDTIEHPRLEVVITVEEEVGMDGAREIDLSMLQGKRLLNVDSEDEGILWVSCAGGGTLTASLPVQYEKKTGVVVDVTLGGLLGGHSGMEIIKERGNANTLLSRVLFQIRKQVPFSLVSMEGGLKDNAIPREAKAVVLIEEEAVNAFAEELKNREAELKKELAVKDEGVVINIEVKKEDTAEVLDDASFQKGMTLLLNMPNGIQAMSASIEGLVETSLNLGILRLKEKLTLSYSVRSSFGSAKEALFHKMILLTETLGGSVEISGDYPAWEYKQDSPLREKMISIYKEMYGTDVKIQAIHAGLECGLFSDKIEGLDCVSFGPNMKNIHTTEERLSIASAQRIWQYILEILKRK